MLTAADDDKNGRLDRREIAQGSPKLTAVANIAARRMGLNLEMELKELPEESMASMEQMDAYPQPGEMLGDPKQAEKLFTRLDANGDKQIVAKEVEGPFAERIGEMIRRGDRNDDQRLNKRNSWRWRSGFRPSKTASRIRPRRSRRGGNYLTASIATVTAPQCRRGAATAAAELRRADADGNGKLAGDELQQVAERMSRRGARRGKPQRRRDAPQ